MRPITRNLEVQPDVRAGTRYLRAVCGLLAAALIACAGSSQPTPFVSPTALPGLALAEADTLTPDPGDAADLCGVGPQFEQVLTVPDDTSHSPGETMIKTWRIRNTGPCAWGNGSWLVFVSGALVTTSGPIPIPDTPPGGEADLSVTLLAPDAPGQYTGYWSIQDAAGRKVGPALYAVVVVVQPAAPAASNTPSPTRISVLTPTPVSPTAEPGGSGGPPIDTSAVIIDVATARQIFQSGRQMGNQAAVFAKVGDSITASQHFLVPLGSGQNILGDYGSLQVAIDYFRQTPVRKGSSFTISSAAAVSGWRSSDPLRKSSLYPGCHGQMPLECEYAMIKPSVALIMLGTNDPLGKNALSAFQQNLEQIVQISIQHGVIPVLSTIPWHTQKDVGPFNAIIAQVAAAHQTPLMDYWSLMEQLPNHGVSDDGIHPSFPFSGRADDFTPAGMRYGYNLRNWLALVMLDRLRQDVLTP